MTKNLSIFSDEIKSAIRSVKGKKDKDLLTHLQETYDTSLRLLDKFYICDSVCEYLAKGLKIDRSSLRSTIAAHVAYHDLGKLDRRFQEKIDGKTKRAPPHPLLSLPLAHEEMVRQLTHLEMSEDGKSAILSLGLLSIASHHSDFYPDLYQRDKFLEPLYENVKRQNQRPYDYFAEAYGKLDDYFGFREDYLRYLYVIFNGVLRASDWISSSNFNVDGYFFSLNEVKEGVLCYIQRKGWGLRDYQRHVLDVNIRAGYMLLPTGDGKTETSLLPHLGCANKVIYTLPTVTTVESMRKRFEEYFGQSNVSFAHHLLFLSLYDSGRLDERLFHKYNMRKAIVTTIDRVLLCMMNYRHYPLFEISLNNSYLVVDEIHSYSPYTLSLIFNGLEYLRKFHNTSILVMSATLPTLLIDKLRERLGAREVIPIDYSRKRYSEKKRVNLKIEQKPIKHFMGEVLSDYKNAQKVLVVLNTVSRAVEVYSALKKEGLAFAQDLYLVHSRFNYGDREQQSRFLYCIEKRNKPLILVATQVIEVSLDIDFDVMYTELSPMDSLIQRFGRVNRKGEKGIGIVKICPTDTPLPYTEKQIEETHKVLASTEIHNELDLLNANDDYYCSLSEWYEDEMGNRVLKDFLERISKSRYGEELLNTRDSFLTIPTIPVGEDNEVMDWALEIVNAFQDLDEREKLDRTAKLMRCIVNVPLFLAKKMGIHQSKELFDRLGCFFIDASYSNECGIVPKVKEELIF